MPDPSSTYALILAGGSGTRFWPLSRNARPKQLLNLFGDVTLLEQTIARLQAIPATEISLSSISRSVSWTVWSISGCSGLSDADDSASVTSPR